MMKSVGSKWQEEEGLDDKAPNHHHFEGNDPSPVLHRTKRKYLPFKIM